MKKLAFFGGTGGLGTRVIPYIKGCEIDSIGSHKVDLRNPQAIAAYFEKHEPEIVVVFSNVNYNNFVHKYSGKNVDKVLMQTDTNIVGVVSVISNALQSMRQKGYGRIILASSVTVDKNVMGVGMYAACKAFYENLVKTTALENASKGITANCIQLGYMDGGLTYTLPEEFLQQQIEKIPAKRLGSPKEIAQTIDFLIKNEYINGTTIKLTGGL